MTSDTKLRLVDLLAEQELGLRLLTDGDPETVIEGVHPIEVDNPTRWLRPGWLMLTTGTRFAGRAATDDAQRELVGELQDAGIAALGVGVGVVLDAVPHALLAEADRRGFPVLSVPLEVPFLQVTDFVNRATSSHDVHLLKRTVSIQDYLLESLADERADASLVQRMAELLRSTVVLYDESGAIVASSGVGPSQIIRSEIRAHPAKRRRFEVGRWHVLTDPITTGNVVHWLAIASRRRMVSAELAEPAMEAARRLVNMIVRSRDAIRVEDRLRRAELVRLMLAARPPDAQYLWERLEIHRFRRAESLRLLMLTDSRWQGRGERLSEIECLDRAAFVEHEALHRGLRLLLAGYGDRVVGVVPAGWTDLRAWLDALPPTVHCGLSEPFQDLSLGSVRYREAELSMTSALRGGHRARRFEDVGLVDWLLASRDTAHVRERARRTLEPIRQSDVLVDTVQAYFANQCDVQRTAKHLALHPNSVRYRLRRVEQLLDCDLRSPADIAELYLSLHADRE